LTVRLVDAAGQPVAKAFVRLVSVGGAALELPMGTSRPSAASGVVEMAVPEGPCLLEGHGQAGTGRATVDARSGSTVPLEIVLEKPRR
jgi:hypothetical protein